MAREIRCTSNGWEATGALSDGGPEPSGPKAYRLSKARCDGYVRMQDSILRHQRSAVRGMSVPHPVGQSRNVSALVAELSRSRGVGSGLSAWRTSSAPSETAVRTGQPACATARSAAPSSPRRLESSSRADMILCAALGTDGSSTSRRGARSWSRTRSDSRSTLCPSTPERSSCTRRNESSRTQGIESVVEPS